MVSIKEGWRMVEASATARAKHDHRRAGKTQCRAEQITGLRPHAIDAPPPQQRDGDVHAALCGVDAAGGGRLKCQQPAARGEACGRRHQQPARSEEPPSEPQPIMLISYAV